MFYYCDICEKQTTKPLKALYEDIYINNDTWVCDRCYEKALERQEKNNMENN